MPMTHATQMAFGKTTEAARAPEPPLEIRNVHQQTRRLVQTVEQLSAQLQQAKWLRHQNSARFTPTEKQRIDTRLLYIEDTVDQVATLAEGVRADADAYGGIVRLRTRVLFSLRCSDRRQATTADLDMVARDLSAQLVILSCGNSSDIVSPVPNACTAYPASSDGEIKPPPPSYDEVVYLSEPRRRNAQRRTNTDSQTERIRTTSPLCPPVISKASNWAPKEFPVELAADEGFGPAFDRASLIRMSTPTSAVSVDELFLQSPLQSNIGPYELQLPIRERRTVSGRQRGLRWMQARYIA